ncbi:DUF3068 domain-containing protein [Corynebacterium lizhenjunii]|uniref:DUF3068 domain-containing protein n=1 Tax=Corynebacterium lizhenjunii TaxID=2709394 RepID=A0A7T0KEV2_9CORY|nr:DUF3068 domain-containing protein [Corynebacterium lizhenjunii]QPK79508.1 DUF3068 domain-containing protein [Corynebacterium lizhenjunii]
MLPVLIGVGAACIAAGIAAPTPQPVLPLDLEHTTYTITDAQAHTRVLDRQLDVPVTAQWHLSFQEPADTTSVTLRVGSSFMRSSMQAEADRLITASVWSYPLDRVDGTAHGPASLSHTLATPTSKVAIDGLWWKFPADAQKTSYDVFDETIRRTAPAVFEEELELGGRTVYRYHQAIEPTPIGTMQHSATRDFYVDQATGLLVDLDVQIRDFDDSGDILRFAGSLSEEDTANLLAQTSQFPSTAPWRWWLLGAGVLLFLLGLAIPKHPKS